MKSKRQHPRGADESGGGGTTTSAVIRRVVRFEITAPEAREVFVAGTFNDWHTNSLPMVRLDSGVWVKELALEPGCYEYLFILDGHWVPDLAAADSVPNPFGGRNSVRTVG